MSAEDVSAWPRRPSSSDSAYCSTPNSATSGFHGSYKSLLSSSSASSLDNASVKNDLNPGVTTDDDEFPEELDDSRSGSSISSGSGGHLSSRKRKLAAALPEMQESSNRIPTGDVTTSSSLPDYCRTLRITDAHGHVRELVFPRGLDLDRPKRARTTFSSQQLDQLEQEFIRNPYLVGKERSQLAHKLQLSETQVKVWFQNRRTKQKREHQRASDQHHSNAEALAASNVLRLLQQQTSFRFAPSGATVITQKESLPFLSLPPFATT